MTVVQKQGRLLQKSLKTKNIHWQVDNRKDCLQNLGESRGGDIFSPLILYFCEKMVAKTCNK